MARLNTTSIELQKKWNELQDIFLNFKKFTTKMQKKLESLGYEVEYNKGNHPKMYIELNNKTFIVTLTGTPSDSNAGRQILRQIRRIYEQNEKAK